MSGILAQPLLRGLKAPPRRCSCGFYSQASSCAARLSSLREHLRLTGHKEIR